MEALSELESKIVCVTNLVVELSSPAYMSLPQREHWLALCAGCTSQVALAKVLLQQCRCQGVAISPETIRALIDELEATRTELDRVLTEMVTAHLNRILHTKGISR